MKIEQVNEKFQDSYALKILQEKVNEIIKVLNDSCTPQTPERIEL
uniref:Uncharacterized protein n=1 Tax=viral metagenome TaxID=1070528 RepID=A0A6H1ZM62_9ZZZZ